MIDEFGMVASDLLLPDPGQQNNLVAIRVRDGTSARVVGRPSGQAAARLGRGAAARFE